MDGAATAAIAWLPQREGSWGMGTWWPAPRSSCYKCALCHAVLQQSIPSCPYILLYERALSAGDLSCERRYIADQKLSKPPKTRNAIMMRACSRHPAVGGCDTVRERALRFEILRGGSRSVVR